MPEGPTTHQGKQGGACTPWCLVGTWVAFLVTSYFPNFSNIPKLIENIFVDFSESVYLPYHVPPYFHDSRVFRKDSFMCSSDVKVWIILLSTLMGVPEIESFIHCPLTTFGLVPSALFILIAPDR